MICIRCSNDTKVINSRPHKKTPSVWRRRQCLACGAIFTTNEIVADDAYTLTVVETDGSRTPFSLPRLMMSLSGSLAHRPTPASYDEAYWLAQTVAQSLEANATDAIALNALTEMAHETLSNFDATAGMYYGAKYGIIHNTAQRPKRGRPRTTRRGIS
jgi:transcriptional repressor NrdR